LLARSRSDLGRIEDMMKQTDIRERQSKKIRKGDQVIAITGNYKGQRGVVQSINGDKVIVQGLNLRKKHVKKSQDAPQGRIVDIECGIHISNLKICANGDQPTKLKVRLDDQGNRQYYYRQGDQDVVYRSIKKPK
jgi:large subunit ribosomal protein L24